MHPTIGYYLAQTRLADLRNQAARGALARTASRAPGTAVHRLDVHGSQRNKQ